MPQSPTDLRSAVIVLCSVCCLAPLATATNVPYGQSGRRKDQQAKAAPQPSPVTRSKRVAQNPTAQKKVATTEIQQPSAPPTPISASSAGSQSEAEEVIRLTSNLVAVPASVVDEQGKAVTNLKLPDFELRIDGQLKPISEFEQSETAVRIALLFDNSGSVTAARETEVQAAVRFFEDVIRPIDQAAIYSVSTVSTLAQPLTNNVRTLVQTIERFGKPEGATALFDGIALAAKYLGPQQGRRVIVIVSDGVDTVSYLDFDTTLKRALLADCQIYVVQTGYTDNANVRDLTAERRMQMFATETGGAVYLPSSTADLDKAFAQIAADLAHQYVLGYYARDDAPVGRFRTISLRVKTRPKLRIRARRGYYEPRG